MLHPVIEKVGKRLPGWKEILLLSWKRIGGKICSLFIEYLLPLSAQDAKMGVFKN
jgi:hypothetical protein